MKDAKVSFEEGGGLKIKQPKKVDKYISNNIQYSKYVSNILVTSCNHI